ncbi:YoaK family protein [Sphingomonas sp. R3G8C]|uniref:YoaK family protein n=1 Tax=Novosphingobium rhizosphaerae TaxID=1551649 RepID=UPI0015CAC4D8
MEDPPVVVRPASPLPRLLLLLSATTGLVDAVSVLGLGKVFTANMTGNVVFLAFALARAPGFTPLPYVVALALFMAGALVAGRLWRHAASHPLRYWLVRAALLEAVLFLVAAGVALVPGVDRPHPTWAVFAMIALTAGAMGFRNATVRQLKVPDLTTTVLTLTITGIAADAGAPNLRTRLGAIAAIFAGAVAGALLVLHAGLALPLALTAVLVLGGTLACVRHPLMALPHRP